MLLLYLGKHASLVHHGHSCSFASTLPSTALRLRDSSLTPAAYANTYKQLPQGASTDLEEAFQDKDDAFECVTALLDDTLEQADAAVDAAKKALKQGDIEATSQVSHQYSRWLTHTTLSNSNMVCEKQHTVCYAVMACSS